MKKGMLTSLFTLLISFNSFSYEYEIAIVSMFKNEAKWLKEWIEYHRFIGVEKFYLYDNDSSDDFEEILEPYINEGIVTYIPWYTGVAPYIDSRPFARFSGYQLSAFNDCVKKTKGKVKWLGILDIDEFINPKTDRFALKKVLKANEKINIGLISFQWRCFGTCELWDIPKGSFLIELINKRAPDDFKAHGLTKYFVRPEASFFAAVHGATLIDGYRSLKYDKIQINHYQYRGRKEAINKRMGVYLEDEQDLSFLNPSQIDALQNIEAIHNLVEDQSIYPIMKEIKNHIRCKR